ncbi:hypothetical protein, partial [Escherichia coli]
GEVSYLNPIARERIGVPPDAPLDQTRIEQFLSDEQIDRYRREVLPTAIRNGHWRGRAQVRLGGVSLPVDCTVL